MYVKDELLKLANHCRVMSDHTFDLDAAREFREIANSLRALATQSESFEERGKTLTGNQTSGL